MQCCQYFETYVSAAALIHHRRKFIDKEAHLKSGAKKVFYVGSKIYADILRALPKTCHATQAENVFSAFYTYMPYYVIKPTEKVK